jgi:hypothetical protein
MARLSLALRYAGLALLAFALTNHVAEVKADGPNPGGPSSPSCEGTCHNDSSGGCKLNTCSGSTGNGTGGTRPCACFGDLCSCS